MSLSEADQRSVLDRYFAAMRQGRSAEADMMALFADEAIYVEPFSGLPHAAVGKAAILERLKIGWDKPLPDLELDVLTIDIVGAEASSTWECRSSALPTAVQGRDTYRFDADGLITRLEVSIDLPA